MPLLSVSKAAKLFDVSRPTLQKALKDGAITGQKVMVGGSESWQIDTAELSRLYALRNPDDAKLARQDEAVGQSVGMDKSRDNADLSGEVVRALEAELKAAKAELDALRADKADAERQLIKSQATADERLRMLNDLKLIPKPDDQAPQQGFWSRLFGR